jgi:hypothetical protein
MLRGIEKQADGSHRYAFHPDRPLKLAWRSSSGRLSRVALAKLQRTYSLKALQLSCHGAFKLAYASYKIFSRNFRRWTGHLRSLCYSKDPWRTMIVILKLTWYRRSKRSSWKTFGTCDFSMGLAGIADITGSMIDSLQYGSDLKSSSSLR